MKFASMMVACADKGNTENGADLGKMLKLLAT
jgi:hypothetical protein